MPGFFSNLLQSLQGRRKDMRFLCHRLLSERGEASQTAIAQEIISAYNSMKPEQRPEFFGILTHEFSPDPAEIRAAVGAYERTPGDATLAALSEAVEAPRQELIRRINTAPHGTETLVNLRADLLSLSHRDGRNSKGTNFEALDSDLRHLFRSWFNRGFLRLERISWQTSARILEKLIRYESVHEINGWPDLRRRLEADRRCFAFFHPALADEPIIFVEVALAKGLAGDLEPLLDVNAPVLDPEKADTAIFYSINNCLTGLRNIPFGHFLIKQVVAEIVAEFPNIRTYSTLSPLPLFARALRDNDNPLGFTRERLSRLTEEYSRELGATGGRRDTVDVLFRLLEDPVANRKLLAEPLERLALAYLTRARRGGKLYDPVATFHLSNGARLERINVFGNLRPYGLKDSYGVTVNYSYLPDELEENHERFVRGGQIRVPSSLYREHKAIASAWDPPSTSEKPAREKRRS
jgi:malonyl-CoA decarboxylase